MTACGNGDSCLGAPITLDTPTNLRVENGVLKWDAVEHAEGYYLDIVSSGGISFQYKPSINSFSFSSAGSFIYEWGIHCFSVQAHTTLNNTVEKSHSNWSISRSWFNNAEKLQTPTNVHIDGNIFRWDHIPYEGNLLTYQVIAIDENGNVIDLTNSSSHTATHVPLVALDSEPGNYYITVRSLAQVISRTNSYWSNPIPYTVD